MMVHTVFGFGKVCLIRGDAQGATEPSTKSFVGRGGTISPESASALDTWAGWLACIVITITLRATLTVVSGDFQRLLYVTSVTLLTVWPNANLVFRKDFLSRRARLVSSSLQHLMVSTQ